MGIEFKTEVIVYRQCDRKGCTGLGLMDINYGHISKEDHLKFINYIKEGKYKWLMSIRT